MSCEYCKYKTMNKLLVESENRGEGIIAWVNKRNDGAYLCVHGWYDGFVGVGTQQEKINYCPMCGEKLSKVVEG